jgi:hypothetical protein
MGANDIFNEDDDEFDEEMDFVWKGIADSIRGKTPSVVVTILIEHLARFGFWSKADPDVFATNVSHQIKIWYETLELEEKENDSQ